jgi:hypothetical protein
MRSLIFPRPFGLLRAGAFNAAAIDDDVSSSSISRQEPKAISHSL